MPQRILARLLLLSAALGLSCRTPQPLPPPPPPPEVKQAPAAPGPLRLTLVGTNDLHGWMFPTKAKHPSGAQWEEGGLSVLAGYLSILREDNPGGVLLLDGGDLFQGTLAANLTEGAPVIDAYNRLGYTASAIGNHEFDYGPEGKVSVAREGEDPFGALKARLKQARFPLLAANIYEAESSARPGWLGNDGTVIVEAHGVKVGIVGLVTPSTPYTTNPLNVASLRFGSLAPEAASAAKSLRARGAEVVVVIAHAGAKCGDCNNPHDTSSCDRHDGEVFDLLGGLPEGTVDAVVAGHTHGPMGHFVRGTPVIETWGLGKYFGTIELFVDPVTRTVLKDRTRIRPVIALCEQVDEELKTCESRRLKDRPGVKMVPATVLGRPVVRDAEVDRLLEPARARVKEEEERQLGLTVAAPLGRHYEAESALGSFLADSLREADGADVALLNPGGLRADLPAGPLTYGSVYNVLPFDNAVAVVTLTGEELKRLLHAAFGSHKGVFQHSGLKVSLSRCPGTARLKGWTLANGKPADPSRLYRVVVPDFLARGGDGLGPVLQSLPAGRIDFGLTRELNFRDLLVSHWHRRGVPLQAPPAGRTTFVDDGTQCTSGDLMDRH
ncbi:MAG: hypothetical protein RL653_4269 [Pseudomonadota bacterium]